MPSVEETHNPSPLPPPQQQAELDDWNDFASDLEKKQEEASRMAVLVQERESQLVLLQQELEECKSVHVRGGP